MIIKRLAAWFILFLIAINQLPAQSLPSRTTWEGKLGNIPLIIRLSEDSLSGQQTAEFDSPSQAAYGIKFSELRITKDSLVVYSSLIKGGFSGAFNLEKTELAGNWKQRAGQLPLVFKRVANQTLLKRPQTPKAPFPYGEEKVIYYNKDKSIQYGATLTLPKSSGTVPAVILITGSGQEDRDESLFGHKLFWVIADHLSRNGIAVLRVDDRGVGETTGNVMEATSADFAKDVLVGVDYLKSHAGIDVKKIGLIGHSEGGVIAPLVAVQSNDIAFIVSMAGVGIKGSELMNTQAHRGYHMLGFSKDEIGRMDSLTHMMTRVAENSDKTKRKDAFQQSMGEWLKQQPDSLLLKVGFKGEEANSTIYQMAGRFFMPWTQYFLKYDPATTLTKIKIPFLALNGGKDVQVSAKENLAGFNTLLTKASNKNFKTMLLPNLNHLFQNAVTGEGSEYSTIEETISPEVLTIITKWIQGLFQNN